MAAPKGNNYGAKMPGDGKERHLHIRIREAQWEIIQDTAKASGRTVSRWVRETLVKKALEMTRPTDPVFPQPEGNED